MFKRGTSGNPGGRPKGPEVPTREDVIKALWRALKNPGGKNLNGLAAVASLLLDQLPKSPPKNADWLKDDPEDKPPPEVPMIPLNQGTG